MLLRQLAKGKCKKGIQIFASRIFFHIENFRMNNNTSNLIWIASKHIFTKHRKWYSYREREKKRDRDACGRYFLSYL